MKNGKWLLGLAFVVLLIGLIYFVNGLGGDRAHETYHVGVFQVVRHPVLDGMAQSFQDELNKRLDQKVQFDVEVPEGDAGKVEQMAHKYASGDYDLVFVIGTNLAQSLAKKMTKVPIVLGGATDPAAAGLVDSWEHPGRNITGTSDLSPVGLQLDRLIELLPAANRVGVIHNPAEDNSKIIVDRFKRECEQRGLTSVSVTIASPNDIQQTVVSLLGKIDALYAPTDATVQSAFPALIRVANEIKLPVFDCDEGTVRNGAVFSVGFNYDDLGRTSAEMAVDILQGRSQPQDMPIQLVGKSTLFFNGAQIDALGLTLPSGWAEAGVDVSK